MKPRLGRIIPARKALSPPPSPAAKKDKNQKAPTRGLFLLQEDALPLAADPSRLTHGPMSPGCESVQRCCEKSMNIR